jgi:magnesium chelatase family protein
MPARLFSATLLGIDAREVEIEADISRGIKSFITVGLPDLAIKESRERVKAAVTNSGFSFPDQAVTVNLAPADLKKEGTTLDLPIALAILMASGQMKQPPETKGLVLGELSLEGTVKAVSGVLSMVLLAREAACHWIMVPPDNAGEAALVTGIDVIPVHTLSEAAAHLQGVRPIPAFVGREPAQAAPAGEGIDFADVRNQAVGKRALEIAAAGGHHVLMVGPPGTGKSLLARRMTTILPPLEFEEALEVTRIQSCAGLLPKGMPLAARRPFRSPHHTISYAGMTGGGASIQPGEISLAHHGVLFLDELTEFRRDVLEALRQPMEDGTITITRAAQSLTFPCAFLFLAAMNPCPCGFFGHPKKECRCTPNAIRHYQGKLSGPLLDRMDLAVEVPALTFEEMDLPGEGEKSAAIRERVLKTCKAQAERFCGSGLRWNARMGPREIDQHCPLGGDAKVMLKAAMDRFSLSGRGMHRVLKVARTIADLEGERVIGTPHVAEALQFRFSRYLESR